MKSKITKIFLYLLFASNIFLNARTIIKAFQQNEWSLFSTSFSAICGWFCAILFLIKIVKNNQP